MKFIPIADVVVDVVFRVLQIKSYIPCCVPAEVRAYEKYLADLFTCMGIMVLLNHLLW